MGLWRNLFCLLVGWFPNVFNTVSQIFGFIPFFYSPTSSFMFPVTTCQVIYPPQFPIPEPTFEGALKGTHSIELCWAHSSFSPWLLFLSPGDMSCCRGTPWPVPSSPWAPLPHFTFLQNGRPQSKKKRQLLDHEAYIPFPLSLQLEPVKQEIKETLWLDDISSFLATLWFM